MISSEVTKIELIRSTEILQDKYNILYSYPFLNMSMYVKGNKIKYINSNNNFNKILDS